MLAILAKQWIGMFVSRMRMPVRDLRRWAHRHRAYRNGLDRWYLNAFVAFLSLALNISLFLFLIGIIIYASDISDRVYYIITGLSFLGILVSVVSTIAPLFSGTCPTATPLLIHARSIAFRILARLGLCEDHSGPTFAEDSVVPDPSIGDIGILSWIFANLAGEQEISVALDAISVLPRDSPSDDFAACKRTQGRTLNRLEQLATRPDLEANASELSRAVRSVLRTGFEPRSDKTQLLGRLADTLMTVRTHDVAVLSRLLCMHAIRAPNLKTHPPGSGKWNPVDDYDGCIAQLSGAFRFWVTHMGQRPSIPVSRPTRDLLFAFLWRSILPTSFCTSLVLTFCRDPDDAGHWIELTNLNLERNLSDSSSSLQKISGGRRALYELPNPAEVDSLWEWPEDRIRRGLQAWSSLFVTIDSYPEDARPDYADTVAQCSILLLERWQFQKQSKSMALPLSLLQTVLAPLTSDVADTPGIISDALDMFNAAVSDEDVVHSHWNATAAQILFRLLERWHFYHPTPDILARADLKKILQNVIGSSLKHSHENLILRIGSGTSVHEAVETSALNLLTPRTTREGSHTSIWRLAISLGNYSTECSFDECVNECVVIFSKQLAALGKFDSTIDISGMFEQLLGNENGARCILWADPTTTNAFDIMCHVASAAPAQWERLRTALMVDQWPRRGGPQRDTPAALVAAAEAELTCVDCVALVQELQEARREVAVRIIGDEENLMPDKHVADSV